MKDKNSTSRLILRCFFTFFIICSLCMGAMVLANCIPKEAIRKQSEKSALYFMEHDLFPCAVQGKNNTRYDNYADCILFHIAWQVNEKRPFQSMLRAVYYDFSKNNVNDNYYSGVFQEKKPNTTYFRYWHGSLCIIRPLLCFLGVEEIRGVLAGILAAMNLALGFLLWKKRQKGLLAAYLFTLILIKIWVAAFCVEYIMVFLLMTGITISFVLYEKAEDAQFLSLSIISGVLTCFFDFLTAETITITVPLLFLMVMRKDKRNLKFSVSACAVWGLSYGGMFLVKWLLCAATMGSRVFQEVMGTAGGRISHKNGSLTADLYRAITYNFSALTNEGKVSNVLLALILFMAIVFFWKGKALQRLLLFLGLIPYVRFAVLRAHSIDHYFFTYRAQIVTIMAFLILIGNVGKRFLKRGNEYEVFENKKL